MNARHKDSHGWSTTFCCKAENLIEERFHWNAVQMLQSRKTLQDHVVEVSVVLVSVEQKNVVQEEVVQEHIVQDDFIQYGFVQENAAQDEVHA